MPGQSQFAGHRHAFFRRLVAGQGQQRTGHGHAGTRAVFRRGAFRHVQVHEGLVEEFRIAAKRLQVGTDVAVGDFGGLFHHFTQLPGELEAAIERVDARRFDRQGGAAHAGPGQAGNHAGAGQHLLITEHGHAQGAFQVLVADLDHRLRFIQQLDHRLAHQLAQLLLQLAHAGFPSITIDQCAQGAVGDGQAVFGHAGFFQLLGPQVALGDGDFFFGDIARQANHFHAVQQRARDRVQGVGGAHEQHFGQVQAQVQVMVEEFDVLFRVQGFQQRRRRVALEALAHLVDLVEHDHRVHHFHVFQRLHQLAGQGADVGAPVALDLGLVAHAADTEAIERPPQGFGDGLAHTRLAHARRAYQQYDGTGDFAFVGAHGEEFEDAALDVIQARMVLVEHFARVLEVEFVFTVYAPRHRGGPVQVVARDGVFRRTGFQDRQFVQFFIDALLCLGRQHLALQALFELFDVGAAIVLGQAQLLLDDLELFLEEELTLVLADLAVYLGGELFLQTRDFYLFAQHRQHFFHAFEHGHAVQHFLQFITCRRGEGGGKVGERRRVVGAEAVEVVLQLFAVQRVEGQQFLDGIDQRHAVGLDLIGRLAGLVRVFDFHQVRWAVVLEPGLDAHAGQALGDELQLAVLAAGVVHLHQGAVQRQGGGVEVAWVFGRRVHEKQRKGVVVGFAHQLQGFGPGLFIDDHRQHLGREKRPVVDRDDVNLVRQVLPRQRQASIGRGGFSVFGVGVIVEVVIWKFLLVAHGAPASVSMQVRWGGVAVVSMGRRR